jgi:predicted PurR-regulated permease PerM
MIWATTIAVATWPTLLRLEQLAGGRRWAAVAIMIFLVLLIFMVPFALAVGALLEAATRGPAVVNDFLTHGLRPPPEWVASIPIAGHGIAERWQSLAAGGPEGLAAVV